MKKQIHYIWYDLYKEYFYSASTLLKGLGPEMSFFYFFFKKFKGPMPYRAAFDDGKMSF